MIQPSEMKAVRPMRLHGGVVSSTTDVWRMLEASLVGDLPLVRALAADTPALLTCQYDYTCPLHLAVREGHLELARYLIEQAGIDPAYRMHPFHEALLTCAEDRGYSEIEALLRESAGNSHLVCTWEDIGVIDRGHDETEKLFQNRVDQGDLAGVEKLLQARPDLALNEDLFWGEGILAMPSKAGDQAMMQLLLQHGARVPTMSKWCAEYYFKNYDSAVFLLEAGMNPNHHNWRNVSLLHHLAFQGDRRKIELLLKYGGAIDPIDEEFRSTPLGFAARWGHREVVELLLELGADTSGAGAPWATPLAWARRKGHLEIVESLRRANAT